MRVRIDTNPEGFKRLREFNEALGISVGDLKGPILVVLGRVHIRQQKRIFATEGAAGGTGRWTALEPSYAARKRKLRGRSKILQLTGDMKKRFTAPASPYYHQRYIPLTEGRGIFAFGAHSSVAMAHLMGNPAFASQRVGPTKARAIFGGVAPRLPVRNVIAKTVEQVVELRKRFVDWYRNERVPQVMRHYGKLLRESKPKRRA